MNSGGIRHCEDAKCYNHVIARGQRPRSNLVLQGASFVYKYCFKSGAREYNRALSPKKFMTRRANAVAVFVKANRSCTSMMSLRAIGKSEPC